MTTMRVRILDEHSLEVEVGQLDNFAGTTVVFEHNKPIDGPAVMYDSEGPVADCQLCGWSEGIRNGHVGEVLARHAADKHVCRPIEAAIYILKAEARRKR